MSKPPVLAIDPEGCGCTECITGLYVPLERATLKQVLSMLRGKIRNNTGETFTIKSEWSNHEWEIPS